MPVKEVVGEEALSMRVEEEPVIKKVKIIDDVENSYEVPMLPQKETLVELEGNEQDPLLDMEEKANTHVASGDARCQNGDENKGLEHNERKIGEALAISIEDRKNDVLGDANMENDGNKIDVSVISAVTSKDEVPVIDNHDPSVAYGGGIKEIRSNLLVSQKKLLVLDLNGLLAHIVSPIKDVKADINIKGKAIFRRPFCEDFLKFCFEKFEIGIWSSRNRDKVLRITDFLLGDMKSKLLFCWDMSYCTKTTVGSPENRHKYIVFKDLNRLWEKHDPKLPWEMGDYNETNTVLLDDSPYKALLNPPYTAIFPHSYSHQNKTTDTSLGDGGDLRLHLEKLVEAENVQEFIKNNPFGQEAITKTSESWEFYEEAIQRLKKT